LPLYCVLTAPGSRIRRGFPTARPPTDLDYRLTVLADGCLDADPEVHQVLLGKVFPRQAEVTTIAGWTAGLSLQPGSRGG
jgi:hypothetical protein